MASQVHSTLQSMSWAHPVLLFMTKPVGMHPFQADSPLRVSDIPIQSPCCWETGLHSTREQKLYFFYFRRLIVWLTKVLENLGLGPC